MLAQEPTKVLFIGNSITYFNDMPDTFEDIANSLNDSTEITKYTPGGTGFVDHATDPNVFANFRQGDWDYIVLQPGSNESPGYSYPIEETLERARILLDSIYKYNPCCSVLFYEISYGVWGNSPEDLETYNSTMSLIKYNLEYLSDSTNLFFAPVGEAFRTKWNSNLNDILWGSYGDIHPNAKGSYIAACTFYSSIFQKPCQATDIISSLSEQTADSIQHLCDSIVLNHLSNWRINTFNQTAEFDFTIDNNSVFFDNQSQNFDSVFWNFDDTFTSVEINPTHSFPTTGIYNVSLKTFNHACELSANHELEIQSITNIELQENDSWSIYPNPVSNDFIIIDYDYSESIKYQIITIDGELLQESNNHSFSISSFSPGHYILKRISADTVSTKKFIKL